MKQSFVLFLVTLILIQSFGKALVVINYQLDKAYIAATLCENKDAPVLKCHGKCYLVKQLKKTDEAEKQSFPTNSKEKFELVWLWSPAAILDFAVAKEKRKNIQVYSNTYQFSAFAAIFQPPRLNC